MKKKKKKNTAAICAAVAVSAVFAAVLFNIITTEKKVVEPTCTEKGYTIYTRRGRTQMRNIVDAKGHSFSEWEILEEPTAEVGGRRKRECAVCGYEETEIYHEKGELPQIHLSGDTEGIGKKEQVAVTAEFSIDGIDFDGYALLKYQGHSSLQYPKKNYTVKFFSDQLCNNKMKFTFSHWNKEHKYILKANYLDASRSRNLICADIWSGMVDSRQNVHPRLKETSNLGAVDGFPAELYLNGSFLGIYDLTLHKDDDLFAMEDGKKDGIVIINDTRTPAAYFKESIDWETTPDWEVEYCGTKDTGWLTRKTDEFVDFVRNSTDAEFRGGLAKHADVDSLIDYLIAVYVLGIPNNAAKDLVLAVYDDGVFIASLFDTETSFGLKKDGSGFYEAEYGLPVTAEEKLTSGTESLLWDRLIENFYTEICSRYKKLRSGVLSEESILKMAEEKASKIPAGKNEAEFKLYPQEPLQDISHLEQITSFTKQRISLLDNIFS